MKKSLLYTALGLMGLMGTLAIGVVKAAETTISEPYGHIDYMLNENEPFEAQFITITDGTDTITILDRNLGAKKAGTGCEDPNWLDACAGGDDTYGYHFQWGNNYGFDPLDTSIKENAKSVSSDGVVWSGIYDNSGYYGTTFIKGDYIGGYSRGYDYWQDSTSSSSNHENLRGGGGDYNDASNGFGKNNENRRGPCPEGFHVPSYGELQKLQSMLNADGKRTKNILRDKLLIPFAGLRDHDGASVYFMGGNAYLWSSSPYSASNPNSRYLYLNVDGNLDMKYSHRANAFSVRCFYDSYQHFTQSFTLSLLDESGVEIASGSVESGAIWTGTVPDLSDAKEGRNFLGRYDVENPEENIVNLETFPITKNTVLRAKFQIAQFTISFVDEDGSVIAEITQDYDTDIQKPANPEKKGYEFIGWSQTIPDTMPAENLTVKAKRTKKSSGGSSGGGGMRKDNCPNGDLSPSYYDGTCEGDNTQDSSDKSSEGQTGSQEILSPADDSFTKEQKDAYTFAFKNGITTMNTIDKANMDGYIKRGHLAKMITNYVVNVLGKEIPSDIPAECLSWTDTYRESDEIKDYATKSCALGLMGINMKNNEFLPNDYVTRSQFGAVLSRILRGDKYNLVPTQEKPRYTDHLNALKNEGIMTKIDNPQMQEKRGYVMIMLMRSVK